MISNREQREAKEKEREIKQFNETLKNSPNLLNDELYLFQNMSKCRLKLKQLPNKHLDNILLMTKYYQSTRDTVNYKYIKKDILNNPLFLNQTISSNPDLYFFISDENKTIFKSLVLSSEKEYLKYLSNSDYDNLEILKSISNSFSYFNESLSCISIDNFKKVLANSHSHFVTDSLLTFSLLKCEYLKTPLNFYLEENKKEKGFNWLSNILNKNPYLYTVLNKEDYKDENSKNLLISLAGKYNDLFPYLPQDWKKDLEIVVQVIKDDSTVSSGYQRYGNNYHPNIRNPALVLNEYANSEDFIKEKLNPEMMLHLRKVYPELTFEWKSKEEIIKGLFKEKDEFEISLDYCRSIPDANLAEKLSSHLKNFKIRTLEHVGADLESIVAHHFMNEKLTDKENKIKQLKI